MQKLPYTEISTLFGVKPNSLDSAQTTTPGIISGERFDNIKYTIGTKTRLTTIENVNPETIVTANGCNISEPSPKPNAKGSIDNCIFDITPAPSFNLNIFHKHNRIVNHYTCQHNHTQPASIKTSLLYEYQLPHRSLQMVHRSI